MPGQAEQVVVACYQNVGLATLRQVEQELVLSIAAEDGAGLPNLDLLAIGKIFAQSFQLFDCSKPELRVSENPRQFRSRCAREEWYAIPGLPMANQPVQPAMCEQERGKDDIGVEDNSRLDGGAHGF